MLGNSPNHARRHRVRQVSRFAWVLFVLFYALVQGLHSRPARAAPTSFELDAMKAQYQRPKAVPFPKNNEYTAARLDLGRQLFFDPRLSGPGTMSCASCHNPDLAWGDGLPTGSGSAANRLDRRSPTLLNLAWGQLMFWDGRADSLEEQAVGPIQHPDEMTNTLPRVLMKQRAIPGNRTQHHKDDANCPSADRTVHRCLCKERVCPRKPDAHLLVPHTRSAV